MTAERFDIAGLYTPQFEQFGVRLAQQGCMYAGDIDTDVGFGSAWIMPVSDSCLVMEHFITPRRNMLLSEYTPVPYACATSVNQSTLDCMPKSGIVPRRTSNMRGPWPNDAVCTFVQGSCGESLSPLDADTMYHSRSIVFLPDYFAELEHEYPEFSGMFGEFGQGKWNEEASSTITTALRRLSQQRALMPGAQLYTRAVIEAMVADLALAMSARHQASAGAGGKRNARLAEDAAALVERELSKGRQMTVDELASHLYVSRSKLCATFKEETGESVAAYARRRRIERAQELLADGSLSIAQIAENLGYKHQAAFTQAFKQACGMTPSKWQAEH